MAGLKKLIGHIEPADPPVKKRIKKVEMPETVQDHQAVLASDFKELLKPGTTAHGRDIATSYAKDLLMSKKLTSDQIASAFAEAFGVKSNKEKG
jgi:hypothetical protein